MHSLYHKYNNLCCIKYEIFQDGTVTHTTSTLSPTNILPSLCARPPSVTRDMKMPSEPSLNGDEPFPPAILKPKP